jgi:inorganic pyrophosphatase
MMTMLDSGKKDHKILAVALHDPEYSEFQEASELPPHRLLVLKRFFQDYKQLEGKQVQVEDIKPAYPALVVIEKALARYQQLRDKLIAGEPH